ncbi:MAG TPA: ankyrin repeat domain-containing protein [Capsulimonadaceae bacterium]|jgi:ankyrin repeat protein
MEKQFFRAVKAGDHATVAELLAANPSLATIADAEASTPLHYAAWKGHSEIAKLLIGSGADIAARNRNDHWGTSPLHAAAHANNTALVTLLIDSGADINATDDNGKTPLFHTSFHKATAAAKLLRAKGATE